MFNDSFLHSVRLSNTPVVAANITEYTLINPRVARAIVTIAGSYDRKTVVEALLNKFNGAVAPIQASFRWLNDEKKAMIGYFATNVDTRLEDKTVIESKYRTVASNMLMDKSDESLWEVKDGVQGQYLVRHGQDNLASLIEASRISPRGSMPRMRSVIQASAAPKEFVAFVNSHGNQMPSMDYGFVIESSVNKKDGSQSYVILTSNSDMPLNVHSAEVVGVYNLSLQEAVTAAVRKGAKVSTTAALNDKSTSIDYYKKLYHYAPEYLDKVIDEVEQQASL